MHPRMALPNKEKWQREHKQARCYAMPPIGAIAMQLWLILSCQDTTVKFSNASKIKLPTSRIKLIFFILVGCLLLLPVHLATVLLFQSRGIAPLLVRAPPLQPGPLGPPIAVFYNLFVESPGKVPFVMSLMEEQLGSLMHKRHIFNPLFIKSIGAVHDVDDLQIFVNKVNNPDVEVEHFSQGNEEVTLQQLWNYCKRNDTDPKQLVTYLHSKGSFHNSKENEQLRKYLTRGALSKECTRMPRQCNVCSSRMSPFPHPHTPGNMWTARCDYIAKLHPPDCFEKMMDGSPQGIFASTSRNAKNKVAYSLLGLVGRGRYALEHWVHSHPDVSPCDLDASSGFVYGYDNVPKDFKIELRPAPRYQLEFYDIGNRVTRVFGKKQERIMEYHYLYNQLPPVSWFGWKFFDGYKENWDWLLDPTEARFHSLTKKEELALKALLGAGEDDDELASVPQLLSLMTDRQVEELLNQTLTSH